MDTEKVVAQIHQIDAAIAENEQRINLINENQANLFEALAQAKKNEAEKTRLYTRSPDKKTQDALEQARDFTAESQKRVALFQSDAGKISGDNKSLWSVRKTQLKLLADSRAKNSRELLQQEREKLLHTLYPDVLRLLSLTAHLNGLNIHVLSLDNIFKKYDQNFKSDLNAEQRALHSRFESLDYAD